MNPESSRTGGTKRKHSVQRPDARASVFKDVPLEDLSDTNFCSLRFLTDQVHKDYLNVYQHRPLESECRFEKNKGVPKEEILERYKDPNYKGLLTKEHANASTVIVREFYANGKYRNVEGTRADPERAFVRKKYVTFTKEDLRSYFGLPVVKDCEYQKLIDQSEVVDVLPTLCAGMEKEVNWSVRVGKPRAMWFLKKGEINRPARWWMYVLCNNVWGIQHVAEVQYERAILIYCCMTGKRVDFPRIMLESIKDRMKGTTRKSLGFPHFITHQCLKANVPIPQNMLDVNPPNGTGYFDLGGPHPPGYVEPYQDRPRPSRGESSRGRAREPQPQEEEEEPPADTNTLLRQLLANQENERKLREKRNRRDKRAFAALSRGMTELQARFESLNPGHDFDPFEPLPSTWSTSSDSAAPSGEEDFDVTMDDEEN